MKRLIPALAIAAAALAASTAHAANFTPGDIVVARVGDGTAALSSAATATFLDEYTPAGTLVQTIALPTAANGANLALTNSGTATSEAFLKLSPDGTDITIAGYNAAPGTASITTSAYSAVNRVVGIVGLDATINTTTAFTGPGTTGNPRSAITDGTTVWMASSANSVLALAAGTAATGTQLSTAPTNTRVVNLSGGQLYVTTASGATLGPCAIGSGAPTTSGQTTTELAGFPTTGTHSNYDYVFANSSTLYVADDGATANGGGIQKWVLNAGTWTEAYVLSPGNFGLRGLTGVASDGDFILYGTSSDASNANKIYSEIDPLTNTTPYTPTFTLVATAATNTAFRGIVTIPGAVPEPASLAFLSLGFAGLLLRRRK